MVTWVVLWVPKPGGRESRLQRRITAATTTIHGASVRVIRVGSQVGVLAVPWTMPRLSAPAATAVHMGRPAMAATTPALMPRTMAAIRKVGAMFRSGRNTVAEMASAAMTIAHHSRPGGTANACSRSQTPAPTAPSTAGANSLKTLTRGGRIAMAMTPAAASQPANSAQRSRRVDMVTVNPVAVHPPGWLRRTGPA